MELDTWSTRKLHQVPLAFLALNIIWLLLLLVSWSAPLLVPALHKFPSILVEERVRGILVAPSLDQCRE
jgi:hypothetical protein